MWFFPTADLGLPREGRLAAPGAAQKKTPAKVHRLGGRLRQMRNGYRPPSHKRINAPKCFETQARSVSVPRNKAKEQSEVSTRTQFYIRKSQWIDAVNARLGRGGAAMAVAMAISRHLNSATGSTFLSRERLAAHCKVCVRTVIRAIARLEQLGLLTVERSTGRGHANVYSMAFPDEQNATAAAQKGDIGVQFADLKGDIRVTPTLIDQDSNLDSNNNRHTAGAVDASEGDRSPKAASPSVTGSLPSASDRSPAMYRQSMVEANCAFTELQRLEGWGGTFGEGEAEHWRDLLRKGYAADDIVDTAADYLRRSDGMVPSLGDWLAYHAEECIPRHRCLVPPRATAVNHHAC